MKNILSVVWASSKLGAACYDIETAELSVLPDMVENADNFDVVKTVVNQFTPSIVIVSSRQDERLLEVLRALAEKKKDNDDDESSSHSSSMSSRQNDGSQSSRARPNNNKNQKVDEDDTNFQLLIVPGKEFAPDPSRTRLQNQRLPDEPKSHCDSEHRIYISSLIPFTSEIMVRAAGSLLRFLDTNGIELFQVNLVDGQIPVLDIKICNLDEVVFVDDTAWDSLQIFSTERHPASSKQGTSFGHKEGLSIYSLLNRCSTAQGSKFLKMALMRPTRNLDILKRRFDVIGYCFNPVNYDFVKKITDFLKNIKSFPKLLYKLAILNPSVKEWKELYQSIYNCLLLHETVACQPREIQLFADIAEGELSSTLKELVQEMMRVIDFEESKSRTRLIPKVGINPELDSKRSQYACLPQIMSLVANEEIKNLPSYINQCSVVYIPEVGYLLAINFWKDVLTLDQLMLQNLEYKFTSKRTAYYKSQRTKELDIVLGDIQVAILDLEINIMIILCGAILNKKKSLLQFGALVSELDFTLALAKAAREYNFVRPTIIEGGDLEIKDGRHPLVELIRDFIPNSTEFEAEERIAVLTGPNASGKSVYLKQVGIIVLMALSGSYVPATFARIPAFDRICTRIHARETISFGLSTFMIDINQIALALRSSTKDSLIIIDEFGKGTAEADGLALLSATINNFIRRQEDCPTVFLSTHFYSLLQYLVETNMLKLQMMAFVQDGNEIYYLHKLKAGKCESSFAHLVASKAGVPNSVIERSIEVEAVVNQQLEISSIKPVTPKEKEQAMVDLADEFLELDIDAMSPEEIDEYLDHIAEVTARFRDMEIPVHLFGDEEEQEEQEESASQINNNLNNNHNNNNTNNNTQSSAASGYGINLNPNIFDNNGEGDGEDGNDEENFIQMQNRTANNMEEYNRNSTDNDSRHATTSHVNNNERNQAEESGRSTERPVINLFSSIANTTDSLLRSLSNNNNPNPPPSPRQNQRQTPQNESPDSPPQLSPPFGSFANLPMNSFSQYGRSQYFPQDYSTTTDNNNDAETDNIEQREVGQIQYQNNNSNNNNNSSQDSTGNIDNHSRLLHNSSSISHRDSFREMRTPNSTLHPLSQSEAIENGDKDKEEVYGAGAAVLTQGSLQGIRSVSQQQQIRNRNSTRDDFFEGLVNYTSSNNNNNEDDDNDSHHDDELPLSQHSRVSNTSSYYSVSSYFPPENEHESNGNTPENEDREGSDPSIQREIRKIISDAVSSPDTVSFHSHNGSNISTISSSSSPVNERRDRDEIERSDSSSMAEYRGRDESGQSGSHHGSFSSGSSIKRRRLSGESIHSLSFEMIKSLSQSRPPIVSNMTISLDDDDNDIGHEDEEEGNIAPNNNTSNIKVRSPDGGLDDSIRSIKRPFTFSNTEHGTNGAKAQAMVTIDSDDDDDDDDVQFRGLDGYGFDVDENSPSSTSSFL